jgi:two-component sensor histidine kinase
MSRVGSERALILAPHGRDAQIAATILAEARIEAVACADLPRLVRELPNGGVALIVEEALTNQDYAPLVRWLEEQPPWSDFPIVVLAQRGGGLERNPAAARLAQVLGNVSFLERPFHPTTLVSIVQTALRGRRRQYEARQRIEDMRLMVNELNHRVKNTLATVQSIVSQTLRAHDAPEQLREVLTARILALSKAHDVLTDEQWAGADLREIAAQAAVPYQAGGEQRLRLEGPTVRLPPKTAIAMALALHELATNAAKYGALSTAQGEVRLAWSVEQTNDIRELHLTWQERNGPPVEPPRRRGFGTRLIERGLAADLQGKVVLAYPPEGVVCTIQARLQDETETSFLTGAPKAGLLNGEI